MYMQEKTGSEDDNFVPVKGLDPETVALKRRIETEVENKVASDYAHIIWAYGIIWALFAGYGLLLWRRQLRIAQDVDALSQNLASKH